MGYMLRRGTWGAWIYPSPPLHSSRWSGYSLRFYDKSFRAEFWRVNGTGDWISGGQGPYAPTEQCDRGAF
jgi:hypothetical protein